MNIGGNLVNRHFPRLEVEVLLAYRSASSPDAEPKVTKSKSFGLGGVMFEAEDSLPVGSCYLVDLVLGDNRLAIEGKVVYSNRISSGLYQNGFAFESLSEAEEDQLTNYFLQEYKRLPQEPI
jgi:c-di-GMP-binding flagellar brake protein YcgR